MPPPGTTASWYRGRWIYHPPPAAPVDVDDKQTQDVLFSSTGGFASGYPPGREVRPPVEGSSNLESSAPFPAAGISLTRGAAISQRLEVYDGQNHLAQPPADLRRETTRCAGRLHAWAHADHGQGAHRWVQPVDCCHKSSCTNPGCVSRLTRERAERVLDVYDRLCATTPDDGGKYRYGAVVFTFPAPVREQQLRDAEARKEAMRAVWRTLRHWICSIHGIEIERASGRRRSGWRPAAVATWHPEGDLYPGDWSPHVHAQVPGWAWSGEARCSCTACRPLRWRRLRVRVERHELALLRRLWAMELWETFGWRPSTSPVPCYPDAAGCPNRCKTDWEAVDVDWQWRTRARPDQYFHRVKYDFRHWPNYHGAWRAVRWFGYLAPRSQALCGLVPAEDVRREKPDRPCGECPACGMSADYFVDLGDPPDRLHAAFECVRAPPWVVDARTVC